MATREQWRIVLANGDDVAHARRMALRAMEAIGTGLTKRTKFATAVSEIARNAVMHGGGGRLEITIVRDRLVAEVVAVCSDEGPGIPHPDEAMRDGFSSGGGLGFGLGGARRLVDRFEIDTGPGRGTKVILASLAK